MSATTASFTNQGMPIGESGALIPASIRWIIEHGDTSFVPIRLRGMRGSGNSSRQLLVQFVTADQASEFPFGCLVRNMEDAIDPLWNRLTAFERAAIVRAQLLAEEGDLPIDPKDDLLELALKTIEWMHQRAGPLPGQLPSDLVLAIGDSGQPEPCRRDETVEIRAMERIEHEAFPNGTPVTPPSLRMFPHLDVLPAKLIRVVRAGTIECKGETPKPWPYLVWRTASGKRSSCYVRHLRDAQDPLFNGLTERERARIVASVATIPGGAA